MAHSIQVTDGKSEIFNDLDLLAVVALAGAEVERSLPRKEHARAVVDAWEASLAGYGPGAIELDLEAHAPKSSEARRQLNQVLAELELRLRRAGDTLPAAELNTRNRAPGVTFVDYATDNVVAAVVKLRALIGP